LSVKGKPLSVQEPTKLDWMTRPHFVSGDIPDINVWLALAVEEHPHHAVAKAYWEALQANPIAERSLWFCRVTMLGLIRLLAQPKVMGQGVLTLAQANAVYQNFLAIPGVGLLADTESTDEFLRRFLNISNLPNRFCTDAYLAALSESSGARLVTFDEDFTRFNLTKILKLNPKVD
jgi:uncharacterized protein